MNVALRLALCLLGALLALHPGLARAQSANGFTLDRLRASDRGQDWFVGDSLDLRGNARVGAGLLGNWSHKSLVLYDAASGDEIDSIVRDAWTAHLFGSVTLVERLRLSVGLPLLLSQSGSAATIGGDRVEAGSSVLGDIRLAATLGLLGVYDSPFSLAVGLQANLPTGDQHAFTSDGTASVLPRALAAGTISVFVYSAEVGVKVGEGRSGWFNETTGEELSFSATAGLRPIPQLTIGPELWGATVLGSSRFFARTATPTELLLGGHYRTGDVQFGTGVGWGLTRGYGAPEVRAVLGVAWVPEPKKAPATVAPPPAVARMDLDRDGDGVADREDACPEKPGVSSDDPKVNGCPGDRDHDGVIDAEDACLEVAGLPSTDTRTNGCPPDRDRDGIDDAHDACPDEAGEASDDPKTNGCPKPKDKDGDGILDKDDACPEAAGPSSEQPQANGCPLARIDSTQIVILEAVRFGRDSDRILPESENVLKAVLAVLTNHPEIEALEVHGHTDDKGADAYNLRLSQRRASSVAKWLTSHGIEKGRIASFGFGRTRPIAPNDSEANRVRNRRVEFHIVPRRGDAK